MKNLFALLFLALAITFSSCKKDDKVTCDNFALTFEAELEAISTAAAAFSSEASTANCNNLKDAYSNYVDVLEAWEDCAATLNITSTWKTSLDEARANISSIC